MTVKIYTYGQSNRENCSTLQYTYMTYWAPLKTVIQVVYHACSWHRVLPTRAGKSTCKPRVDLGQSSTINSHPVRRSQRCLWIFGPIIKCFSLACHTVHELVDLRQIFVHFKSSGSRWRAPDQTAISAACLPSSTETKTMRLKQRASAWHMTPP